MRKLKFLSFLLVILLLPGCVFDEPEYIKNNTKPNNYFYTNEIYGKLKKNENFSLELFNSDLYKYYEVDTDDHDILLSFIESLRSENYHDELTSEQKDLLPKYKLIIKFDNSKFIINIFNDNLATIYPWDGVYSEDVISFEGMSDNSNLFEFCHYVENKHREK